MTGGKGRVLLVEDDRDQAELVRRTLARQDPSFEVSVVGDGPACLEALGRERPSVVLLDFSLPKMDGLQVLAEIQKRAAPVPVIMVTGQGDERVAVEAVKAGAFDYVIKTPGYLTTLPTVISKVLKQHELARENARLYEEARGALAELQAAQEQLVRGATLRALGEMASGAAHHLNNLLAVVTLRADLLLRTPQPAAVEGQVRMIQRAATDAAEVVRRVQQFARRKAPERQPVDLREVAAETWEMTRGRWQDASQAAGISIEVALETAEVPLVMGNAAAFREVATNLVLNAVDALPEGGRITIRTFVEGQWICLAVSDTGTGMSDEVRQRALEPFFTTKGPGSTGLGLSVNYGILKEHGGDLHIQTEKGRGTTITIRLPSAGSVSSFGDQPPATPQAFSRRLLLIDDDERVREALVDMLVEEGHQVLKAAGGREGLRLLEEGAAVDLVVTDLGMPDMTGWEVARAIKARWPQVPVALLTGWSEAPDMAPEDAPAVARILTKPVTFEALQDLLAAADFREDSTS
jgi:signal transduction histidine kinase